MAIMTTVEASMLTMQSTSCTASDPLDAHASQGSDDVGLWTRNMACVSNANRYKRRSKRRS